MNGTLIWQGRAQGKLLLTGEYAVLDGAWALASPVRYGQTMAVTAGSGHGQLTWISRDEQSGIWFEAAFSLPEIDITRATDRQTAGLLQNLLRACRQQQPGFLSAGTDLQVETTVDFPREWGLGTSSTLLALLARWAEADPYTLLFETLGGSGYDLACAFARGPLLYRLQGRRPAVEAVDFMPPFSAQLFFVFLGKKQNSRDAIHHYRQNANHQPLLVEKISLITRQCLKCTELAEFSDLLLEHERLIGQALGQPRAGDLYFPDFPGVIKSLGAWGGDFVLAAGQKAPEEIPAYFREKGFPVCIPFQKMIF